LWYSESIGSHYPDEKTSRYKERLIICLSYPFLLLGGFG
jgi:hypothetical protein